MKRRPLSQRAMGTKDAILNAAAHILLKDGIDRFNTNLVAQKAGVSIGSLYQYYSNKEDLFEDLMCGIVSRRQERIRAALDSAAITESLPNSITKVVEAIFDDSSDQEIQLESLLLPLMFRAGNEKKAMKQAEAMEGVLRPILKAVLSFKSPKILKRDLDTVIFVLIQSLRGVFLASGACRSINKNKLKQEVAHLISNYLSPLV